MQTALIAGAPELDELESILREVDSAESLANAVLEANYIEVGDDGVGMSREDLEQIYLTIGTSNRVHQRERERAAGMQRTRPLLGEKGLGRLSAMRLGDRLHVRTAQRADRRWNLLDVDWTRFAEAGDVDFDTIEISPTRGALRKH